MAIRTGSRIGPYEVLSLLGAGGMGEVYRAHDRMLNRDVALKILPDAFAEEPERLARFTREAQTLAALNHPNIAHIHGLEESGGVRALVMELVEGDELSARIARGPLPLDEALPMARQIAEALQTAHEQGIIHRDLKPANIKVRADGVVKVLDFGLAKAMESGVGNRESGVAHALANSPTITSPAMTMRGMILGTAAYMSPEQAKGRAADRRSDIWAFGCVLYEMLTGRRAFDGEDMTDVLGAVVRLEPNWQALPADVPQPVRTLLQGCLVKDRGRRVADISTALFVLDKSASLGGSAATVAAARLPRPPLWRRVVTPVAVALLAATVAGTGVRFATRAAEPPPPRVSRLLIAPSGTAAMNTVIGNSALAISPDGARVVYVGNNATQLFVRALDDLEPAVVFTSVDLSQPFISPDGQWIGFVEGGAWKKVAVTGGPAFSLASLDGAARGATWGADDAIIAATTNAATGLQRVTAAGGPATVLTRPDPAQGEADHVWPERLPGGRAVLFTIIPLGGRIDTAQVAVLDLQTGTRKVLVRGGSLGRYVPSGHLVFAASSELRAVPFDLARLETHGTPVTVVRNVMTSALGVSQAVVAGDGTLAYLSGAAASASRTLVWVDRQGRETPIPAPPRRYVYPRLSADGTRVAVVAVDQDLDVWVWDLGRSTLTRATFDAGAEHSPVWTPDGLRLIFSSERAGIRNLYWQAANTTGAVERLAESARWQHASGVSPDGRRLVFTERSPGTAEDIMQLELDGTHRVTPVLQSPFTERNGVVSPDGRWLAYEANDSGPFEISVRPFPDVNSGHWRVSSEGGTAPLWTRNGEELIYVSPTGGLMSVGVTRSPSWAASRPVPVLKEGYVTTPNVDRGRNYDIAADGRFLMVKEGRADQTAPVGITVVQHWGEELKRLVPTR
jgi:eukaryotic-like serine/threonine-protein kinase